MTPSPGWEADQRPLPCHMIPHPTPPARARHRHQIHCSDPPGSNENLRGACTTIYECHQRLAVYGKHIRITSWLKTSDVQRWAGTGMAIVVKAKAKGMYILDFMDDRPIRGTMDWQQTNRNDHRRSRRTLPPFIWGPNLYGPGELWTTIFKSPSPSPPHPSRTTAPGGTPVKIQDTYSETIDALNRARPGTRPVVSPTTPDAAAPDGSWMWWGQKIHPP